MPDPGLLQWSVVFPDAVTRPALRVGDQQAVVSSPALERNVPWWTEQHPDTVVRPTFIAAEQQPVTTISPSPITGSPVFDAWTPFFPDRHFPKQLSTADQQFVSAGLAHPERTAPWWQAIFMDAVTRPTFGAGEQLARPTINPLPETHNAPWWQAIFMDAVTRPRFLPGEQEAYVLAQRERTAVLYSVLYPDTISRPAFLVAEQIASAVARIPDRTFFPTYFPDRIPVTTLATAEQQVSNTNPFEERKLAFFSDVWPDAVMRPTFHPEEQQALAFLTRERSVPFWMEQHPDRVDRPTTPADDQQPATNVSPLPQAPTSYSQPSFPDGVVKAFLRTADQLAVTGLSPLPERPRAYFSVVIVDRVSRSFLGPEEQLAVTDVPPLPRPALVILEWGEGFPGPQAVVSRMAAPLDALPPRPERAAPHAPSVFPDWMTFARYGAAEQQAVTELSPQPRPNVVVSMWQGSHPDAVPRPRFLTADQVSLALVPDYRGEAQWFTGVWPHTVSRPIYRAEAQQARESFYFLVPAPTGSVNFGWAPVSITRPMLITAAQLSLTGLSPLPIPNPPVPPVLPPPPPGYVTVDAPGFKYATIDAPGDVVRTIDAPGIHRRRR